MRLRLVLFGVLLFALQGCAAGLGQLGALVQPPRFEQIQDRPAEIRMAGLNRAGVRLWARGTNPNPFGLTLGTLKGTLFLDESRAADADFPLGLPLGANAESEISTDISISFSDLPGLSGVPRRILARQPVGYRLDGTIGVADGRLRPTVIGATTT